MRTYSSLIGVWLLNATCVLASEPYNPYAVTAEEAPPISADGKLNWPPFFQDVKMQAKYASMFETGNCRGNSKDIVGSLQANRVEVNHLPEITATGRSVRVDGGVLYLIDARGQSLAVVTHPANVTHVDVSGQLPPQALHAGMVVRLRAKLDAHGRSEKPVEAVEVITGNPEAKDFLPLRTNQTQMIVGQVSQVKNRLVYVKVPTGSVRRAIIELDSHATIDVHANGLPAIHAGDQVTVTGHVYAGPGSLASATLFASTIDARETFAALGPKKR